MEGFAIMKRRLRRAAASLAALFSAAVLCTSTVWAETLEGDLNGDGVINVYDFILAKRDSVDASSPVVMRVTGAEGAPGSTVTVAVELTENPGSYAMGFIIDYSGLELAETENPIRIHNAEFSEYSISYIPAPEVHRLSLDIMSHGIRPHNGTMLELDLTIPENVLPGTILTVDFLRAEVSAREGALPILTERGKITVLPTPEPPKENQTFTMIKGCDVSSWQGNIDWATFAQNPDINFAMLRAGYGRYAKQVDSKFYRNYQGAKAAGVPVGAYWYSYAMTPYEARLEARACAEVIKGLSFEYPIAFDFEEKSQLALPVDQASAIVDAFCSEMESMGYYVVLYCSSFYLNHTINQDVKDRYDIWCAHYNVPKPTYLGSYGMWQYGIEKNKAGCIGDVDMDNCYKDYPAIMRRTGLNGNGAVTASD